jgi:hypothetical protein
MKLVYYWDEFGANVGLQRSRYLMCLSLAGHVKMLSIQCLSKLVCFYTQRLELLSNHKTFYPYPIKVWIVGSRRNSRNKSKWSH